MPRFAANLGFLFTELPFLDRFAAARDAGFEAVEFASPYEHSPQEIAARLRDHGLACILFNFPPASPGAGPAAGLGAQPGAQARFREGVERALDYAAILGNRRINCIAGSPPNEQSPERCEAALVENLAHACERLAAVGMEVALEPINSRDTPGFFVDTCDKAARVIAQVARPNLGLQCDLYHVATMGEDPLAALERHMPIIRHIQFADAPGRGEPGSGRLRLARCFERIDAHGYEGWVAAEYRPTKPTRDTLHWLAPPS